MEDNFKFYYNSVETSSKWTYYERWHWIERNIYLFDKAIYNVSVVHSSETLQPSQIAHKLSFRDEEGEVKGSHELQLQRINVLPTDTSYLGVELILVVEIVEIFSGDHNAGDEESEWGQDYLWML